MWAFRFNLMLFELLVSAFPTVSEYASWSILHSCLWSVHSSSQTNPSFQERLCLGHSESLWLCSTVRSDSSIFHQVRTWLSSSPCVQRNSKPSCRAYTYSRALWLGPRMEGSCQYREDTSVLPLFYMGDSQRVVSYLETTKRNLYSPSCLTVRNVWHQTNIGTQSRTRKLGIWKGRIVPSKSAYPSRKSQSLWESLSFRACICEDMGFPSCSKLFLVFIVCNKDI